MHRCERMRVSAFGTQHQYVGGTHPTPWSERDLMKVGAQLPEEYQLWLKMAGQLGDELGMEVYAVGGFVRDILLIASTALVYEPTRCKPSVLPMKSSIILVENLSSSMITQFI